ncbi:MAG: diaminopimelate decarboxylase, partial [Epsilonproteobacteria bacterium]
MQIMKKELWWERKDLLYKQGSLLFAERSVFELAQATQTPAFFYSTQRIRENIQRLLSALTKTDIKHRIFYAMKANRHAPLLTYLKTTGLCGIDACSPQELLFARSCGFESKD